MDAINMVEQKYMKDKKIPEVRVGDTLSITTVISGEGKGKRLQTFKGILISDKGKGIARTLTLRRISYGEGVEKVFPVYSPNVKEIKIDQRGYVRRAKLYYLRQRIGKRATKVKRKEDR